LRQFKRKRVLADPEYHRAQLMWTITVGVVVALAALHQATNGIPRNALMEEPAAPTTEATRPMDKLRSAASSVSGASSGGLGATAPAGNVQEVDLHP
jgi:hypothetical protein